MTARKPKSEHGRPGRPVTLAPHERRVSVSISMPRELRDRLRAESGNLSALVVRLLRARETP